MIENRNVNIITDADGKKLVLINDIRFKGKRQIDWDDVKQYLEGYVGDYYEIEKMRNAFISEMNFLKNIRNQKAVKALWVQMQKRKQMPLLRYRS